MNIQVGQVPVTFSGEVPDADTLWVRQVEPTFGEKLDVDRMFSLVKIHTEPLSTAFDDTTLALIGTAGGAMEYGLALLEQTFELAAGIMQKPFESLLVPFAPRNPEEIEGNAELKEKAAAFGRKLAGA